MVNSPPKSDIEDENDLFYFESDHLALKGNKDYSELLKTLFILQAQQVRAIQDYDTVVTIHKHALENPMEAVEKLKTSKGLSIPPLQNIAEVPNINWSKYDVSVPEDLKLGNTEKVIEPNKHKHKRQEDSRTNGGTHKQHWTSEEQKRLEELLIIYPPEPIEIRRFKKIAAALGNRTTRQVCSRVQKYFVKLYKAGLPIPGRIPKCMTKYKKSQHKHQRLNHYLMRPTTFFPELDIPVVMNDADEIPGPSTSSQPTCTTSNYLLPAAYQTEDKNDNRSDADSQLEILKLVRQEKERELSRDSKPFCHVGYKCDYCNEEPINGARWHCVSCENDSVDFCTDCIVAQMYTENSHPLSHRFTPVRGDKSSVAFSFSDSDSSSSSIRNYQSSDDETNGKIQVKTEYNPSDFEMELDEEYVNGNEGCAIKQENFSYEYNPIIKFEGGNSEQEINTSIVKEER